MKLDTWFLTRDARGNPFTSIDARHDGSAWSTGNDVTFIIDGTYYFERLCNAFASLESGDQLYLTDWRSDGDERLSHEGPTLTEAAVSACARGVDVRGLLWRSHSDHLAFSAKENRQFARTLTAAGGIVLLDERVRRGGSHHQKMLLFLHPRRPERDVAFVGGIDLSHGRRDDSAHHGDAQTIKLDPRYGPRPAWHDVQLELRGPVISELETTFRERWQDPTPLNHSGRLRAATSRLLSRDRVAAALSDPLEVPKPLSTLAVQVLRTYPIRQPHYPFAPYGERSVARAFAKAIDRARALIYIEDQYFWSKEIATLLARALKRQPQLQLIVVVPRYPDKDGVLSGPPSRLAQERAIAVVKTAGGDRVSFYDLENEFGAPVYVHAKVCVIDDVWATVGSDNLNRRSWTHDSELSCAIIDEAFDERSPRDPGGLGDGSRQFARRLRTTLWGEHLGRNPDDPELLDVARATELWRTAASELSSRRATGGSSASTQSRVRLHRVDPVRGFTRVWAFAAYRLIFDPDGRPLALRLRNRY